MIFNIGRVAVYISYPFAAMLALILLLDKKGIAAAGLLAAFFHEMGHLLWMVFSRTKIKRVGVTVSGIDIQTTSSAVTSYRYEAALALAGPFFNLLAVLLLFFIEATDFTKSLYLANLALLGVNILPIQSLDGGSALKALLCLRLSSERVEKITFLVSILFLIPLLILGFIVLLDSRYNFSLLILALLLLYHIADDSKEYGFLGKDIAK